MSFRFRYRTVALVFIMLTTASLHACRRTTRYDVAFDNQTFTLLLPSRYEVQPVENQCPSYSSFLGGNVVTAPSGMECYAFQLYPLPASTRRDDQCCGVLQVAVTQLTNRSITSASDAVQQTWQHYLNAVAPESQTRLILLSTDNNNRLAFNIDYEDITLPGGPFYVDLIQHMAVFHKDNDKLTVLWASKIVYTATEVDEELEAIADSFRFVEQ